LHGCKVRFCFSPQVFSKSILSGRKHWITHHCWLLCIARHMPYPDYYWKALECTQTCKEAYKSTEHIGDIYGQAWSLYNQARCHTTLAHYQHSRHLLQNCRDMLSACGQQQNSLGLNILNYQAEFHLLKSEYRKSRQLQVAIASSCHPTSYKAILANLNIALIDIAIGADSKIICQNLDVTQSHLKAVYGYPGKLACLTADLAAAELHLRDGAIDPATAMFEKCFDPSLNTQLALLSAERLGDPSTSMNGISTTLRWAGIFSAEGDDETALSLFHVALDGFTFMDVHRWRADCMVRIADILNSHGEVMKAVGLWKSARPLFKRSSQMKDVTKLDEKLAEVDSAVLVEYEEKLQHLSELHVLVVPQMRNML
ncbi:hypothetical protein C8J57DRAFT_1603973, partial [Mycena rebaudengoi]